MTKGEKRIKSEKTATIGTAVACITTGIQQTASGNPTTGVPLFVLGIALLYAREHWKLGRWGEFTLKELRKDLERM